MAVVVDPGSGRGTGRRRWGARSRAARPVPGSVAALAITVVVASLLSGGLAAPAAVAAPAVPAAPVAPAVPPAPVAPAVPPAGTVDRYNPVTPTRLREPEPPVTGTAPVPVPVAGRAGIPTEGAGSVVLAVTATSPTPGSVTVWSGEGPPPAIPGATVVPGRTATASVITPVGPDGRVLVAAGPGPVSVAVDVLGWFPTASTLVTGAPTRLLDSRGGTVDGRDARRGPLQAGAAVPIQIGGRGFGSSPVGSAVLLSVSAARATVPSGITAWPSGSPQPPIPSVPVTPGADAADLVFTRVGRDGAVDLALDRGSADVVVDLVAVVPEKSVITPVTPARVLDSRPGTVTVDGRDAAAGALVPGTDRRIALGGRGGVPPSATAVLAHLTATSAAGPSQVRAFAGGTPPPGPSVAVGPGETRSGLVVLPLAPDGTATVRADDGPADLAVDVQGWIGVGPEPPRAADQLLWRGDLETGDLSQFKDTPWNFVGTSGPKVVTGPVRGGQHAVQFTMPGGGKRAEIEPDVPNFSEGQTRFFAVSVFLAPGFPASTPDWQVITQWKNTGTGSPPIEIKVGKGRFYFDGGSGAFSRDIAPAATGRWVDLVVGMTFSGTSSKSKVDAWADGRRVVTDFRPPGGTLYRGTSSYLKTGIYRDEGISQRGVLTMDNWKVGTSYASVTGP